MVYDLGFPPVRTLRREGIRNSSKEEQKPEGHKLYFRDRAEEERGLSTGKGKVNGRGTSLSREEGD